MTKIKTQGTPIALSAQQVFSAPWALASLSLSMLLASLGTSIATVGLPALAEAFDASFQQVQWVVLAYLLTVTTLIVSAGKLGDLLGRRRLIIGGLLLFTLASALCGLAPSLGLLMAGRALQGLGAAIMMALTMAFVAETVAKAKTGSAMGLLATMSAVGVALGPSLGGALLGGFGWRALFLITVPLGLLASVLAWRYLPAQPQIAKTAGVRLDGVGTLVLAATLAAYALAMTLGQGHFGLLNIALLLMAAAGVRLFVWSQTKVSSPLIPLAMFRDRSQNAGLAMSALVAAVMMATLVVGPFYLAQGLGLPAALVGLIMTAGPSVAALTGVPAGRLADRFGVRSMMLTGLTIMTGGCLMLARPQQILGIGGYLIAIVVMTLGYALFQTANNTSVMADVHPDQRGVISGLLNLSRNLGLFTGASALSAVFAAASATNGIAMATPNIVANGLRMTFSVALALVLFALIIALRYRVPEPSNNTGQCLLPSVNVNCEHNGLSRDPDQKI